MKLQKAGYLALAAGVVVSIIWALATPEVSFGPNGRRACSEFFGSNNCVADVATILLRFVMGTAGSVAIAYAVSAFSSAKGDTDQGSTG